MLLCLSDLELGLGAEQKPFFLFCEPVLPLKVGEFQEPGSPHQSPDIECQMNGITEISTK